METLKREVLSIIWDKGYTEEEIVKVLRVTLAEVKKYGEEQEKWL